MTKDRKGKLRNKRCGKLMKKGIQGREGKERKHAYLERRDNRYLVI